MKLYVGHGNTVHDPALALIAGDAIFAESIERHTQCKRALTAFGVWYSEGAIQAFLRNHAIDIRSITQVSITSSWNRERLKDLIDAARRMPPPAPPPGILETQYQAMAMEPSVFAGPLWCALAAHPLTLHEPSTASIGRELEFFAPDHHLCHAAGTVYTSPFEECVVMILDGGGEMESITFYHFENDQFRLLSKTPPVEASLGGMYMLVTGLCGFLPIRGEEWKLMGLAAYGKPNADIYDFFKSRAKVDGLATRWSIVELLGATSQLGEITGGFRSHHDPNVLKAADLAHNFQRAFTDVVCELARNAFDLGLSRNLAYGGGCALNSAANGQILARSGFETLHVPSAPADDGNALGAALYQRHAVDRVPRRPETMSPFLGSTIDAAAVEKACRFGKFSWEKLDDAALCRAVAERLVDGAIVGWVQGRAEFGPRALGNRSILADPRSPTMKDTINSRVKFREQYRPLAPAILHEFGPEYFEDYAESPYMERTLAFRPEVCERVPAVVHVDGTGRLQTVKRELTPLFYQLVQAFYELTGVPILLNTSLNVMGKPIVHRVEDVMAVFATTGLDYLAIGSYFIAPRSA